MRNGGARRGLLHVHPGPPRASLRRSSCQAPKDSGKALFLQTFQRTSFASRRARADTLRRRPTLRRSIARHDRSTISNASSRPGSTTSRSKRRSKSRPRSRARLNNTLLLKREDMQPVFSFKLRGAYNKMAAPARGNGCKRGVICASAGNHAQGVAFAAQRLGCKATIVMPVTTPQIKVSAVAARGARVMLIGDSYDDAYARCDAHRAARESSPSCTPTTIRTLSPARARSAWRSCAAQRADRRDLRRGRRRRTDLRHRGLRETAASGDQDHRRRADRFRRHDASR